MAKDVNFFGSWMDVPYVDLPQIGGGSARFTNIDDTTATAPDVSSTKYFYTAAGVRTKGTGTTGSPSYQAKTVTPSETQQTVTADNTYDALSSVTVKGITASYVGSGVTRKSSTDLTVSGATITAPAGYYASAATKSVASTTRATPTISVNSSGLITATVTQSAGYVTAGTTSTTSQLSTQAGKTVTPSQSAQTAVASGKYTTGTITVAAIPSEYIIPEGSISITTNGTDIDVSQYATADVAVPTGGGVNNQNKTVTPSESKQTITPDSGYTGLGTVTVNAIPTTYVGSGITQRSSTDLTMSGATVTAPAGYYASAASKTITAGTLGTPVATKGTVSNHTISVTPKVTNTTGYITGGTKTGTAVSVSASELVSGTLEVTTNGTKDVTNYATVSVAVPVGQEINNQNKTVTPSESQQTVTADSGYTGLGTVTVKGITASYVGSGVTQRSSSDLTVSGATVTAPAGYYASAASKSVTTMTLPTTTAAAATSGYTSKATVSRSTSDQYINIPPGYNSAGGYYKISAVANGSSTPPATISGSSASLTTGTNTLTLSKTISVTPVVNAGYISAGTAGNVAVTLTASVTTKAAATITPGTSNQTIASGTYLTGTQTIAGAASLTTANIKDGVNIFGVTGSYTSDATASAADIVSGKTGYVAGNKVTGSLVIQNYYTGSSTPSSSLGSNGDIYIQQ